MVACFYTNSDKSSNGLISYLLCTKYKYCSHPTLVKKYNGIYSVLNTL